MLRHVKLICYFADLPVTAKGCVRIIKKPVSSILKEYSKLFSILCSWEYANRLSYFRRDYQQRKDCVSESHKKNLRNNGRME